MATVAQQKMENFTRPTYSGFKTNFVDPTVYSGIVPLRYRFLFCGNPTDRDEDHEISGRCFNLLEFAGYKRKSSGDISEYLFFCKNCKFQAIKKAEAIASQQKWTGSNDFVHSLEHEDLVNYPNDRMWRIYIVDVPPFEEIYRLEEVIDGPNCFMRSVLLSGDDRTKYFLKGIVPDKLLK